MANLQHYWIQIKNNEIPNHQNGKCTTLNHGQNVVLHIHNYFRHPKYTPEKREKKQKHISYYIFKYALQSKSVKSTSRVCSPARKKSLWSKISDPRPIVGHEEWNEPFCVSSRQMADTFCLSLLAWWLYLLHAYLHSSSLRKTRWCWPKYFLTLLKKAYD